MQCEQPKLRKQRPQKLEEARKRPFPRVSIQKPQATPQSGASGLQNCREWVSYAPQCLAVCSTTLESAGRGAASWICLTEESRWGVGGLAEGRDLRKWECGLETEFSISEFVLIPGFSKETELIGCVYTHTPHEKICFERIVMQRWGWKVPQSTVCKQRIKARYRLSLNLKPGNQNGTSFMLQL